MQGSLGINVRQAGRDALAQALLASRSDTLATFAVFEAALAARQLRVPCLPVLNPPLWELGHIGWFQEWWIARNAERERGTAADPDVPRPPGVRSDADALYHSSRVPHASRWSLPLPDADTTRDELARQLQTTLAILSDAPQTAAALYFFRLALLHEDMHHEAAINTAGTLGIELPDSRWATPTDGRPRVELALDRVATVQGLDGPGFVFDNERTAHPVTLQAFAIDSRAICWSEYLPFIESGAYRDPRCWCEAGWRWRSARPEVMPRDLRRDSDGGWQQRRGSGWRPLLHDAPAAPLCWFEADAWCRWAGRRLPTEAEWEHAALHEGDRFTWGAVWEWTSSVFAPYPGFTPHPYRDYSAPWFDGRPVLRGASSATQPRVHHPRYRNFYTPERDDLRAGFRSCRA